MYNVIKVHIISHIKLDLVISLAGIGDLRQEFLKVGRGKIDIIKIIKFVLFLRFLVTETKTKILVPFFYNSTNLRGLYFILVSAEWI